MHAGPIFTHIIYTSLSLDQRSVFLLHETDFPFSTLHANPMPIPLELAPGSASATGPAAATDDRDTHSRHAMSSPVGCVRGQNPSRASTGAVGTPQAGSSTPVTEAESPT